MFSLFRKKEDPTSNAGNPSPSPSPSGSGVSQMSWLPHDAFAGGRPTSTSTSTSTTTTTTTTSSSSSTSSSKSSSRPMPEVKVKSEEDVKRELEEYSAKQIEQALRMSRPLPPLQLRTPEDAELQRKFESFVTRWTGGGALAGGLSSSFFAFALLPHSFLREAYATRVPRGARVVAVLLTSLTGAFAGFHFSFASGVERLASLPPDFAIGHYYRELAMRWRASANPTELSAVAITKSTKGADVA